MSTSSMKKFTPPSRTITAVVGHPSVPQDQSVQQSNVSIGQRGLAWRSRLVQLGHFGLVACLGLCAAPASALDFGTLRLYLPSGQAPYAEITLTDSAGLDPSDIRARIATPDAYGVAGMRYIAALQSVQITPVAGASGQVVLRLDRLPAPGDAADVDLLLLVGDRMSLALGEYRVNLQGGRREFAAAPAGTRLASAAPSGAPSVAPAATLRATTGAVSNSAPNAVAIPPVERPPVARAAGATDASVADAQAALEAWAQAWSRRDVDAYLAAYTPDFAGRGGKISSREAWAEQRRTRILAKKRIAIEIIHPQFSPRGDTVVATFTQSYRGDDLVERSRKRLVLVKSDNRWLIQDEGELP